MKKTLLVLPILLAVLALAVCLTVSASAEDVIHSGNWGSLSWKLNETTGELTISGTGKMEDFDVSSDGSWQVYRYNIKTVTIKSGVTSIGQKAFVGYTELTSITIPDSVTSIGEEAFAACTKLTSITIPNSVTSIGEGAFLNCPGLTSIVIPESVTSIGYRMFYGCTGLTSVTIPNGVTNIGEEAFYGCTSLTSIAIPHGVTSIGYRVFDGCKNLTSITIPDSVTSIDTWAFDGCNKLFQVENGVSYVDKWVISCDASVSSVILRNNTVGFCDAAFFDCSHLTSITIPDSVKIIGEGAFQSCYRLMSITIPASVTRIGNSAFSGCSQLVSITVDANNSNYYSQDGILYNKPVTEIIHAPKKLSGNISIAEGITSIPYDTFRDCTNLTGATIPNGVTTIDSFAFSSCSSLISVTIPDSVTSIGQNAFGGCRSLTGITLPSSLTRIEASAFWGCEGLTSITIPDSVTSIGEYVFMYCTNLNKVYFSCKLNWESIISGSNYGVTSDKLCVIHAWNSGETTTDPTHLALGVTTFTCFDCKGTKTEDIAKLTDHTYGEWTKKDDALHQKECACGDIQTENHIYDNNQDTTCNICGSTSESTTEPVTEPIAGEQSTKVPDGSNAEDSGCGSSLTSGAAMLLLLVATMGGTLLRKRKI